MTQPSDAALRIAREIAAQDRSLCETTETLYRSGEWDGVWPVSQIATAIDEAKRQELESMETYALSLGHEHYDGIVGNVQLKDNQSRLGFACAAMMIANHIQRRLNAIRNRQP